MAFEPLGRHFIRGEWLEGAGTFTSTPAHGPVHQFAIGTVPLVDKACVAADEAFLSYGQASRKTRAAFVRTIADEVEARADDITVIGAEETGLPAQRMTGERARTTNQLRQFADVVERGDYLNRRISPAMPDRQPAPRPEIRMLHQPVGPVAVFGASNFPLAFSTVGGDTASALAAGCPVVVKAHAAHPGTSELVAHAVEAAIRKVGVHPGVFALIHEGPGREVGQALVKHPLIKAVGFTGSLAGGRALFNLCAARPEPIPFFGELGSVNPMFLLPEALAARAEELGRGWAASLVLGAGQYCTNPGIAVVIESPATARFLSATVDALGQVQPQTMLTEGIAQAYRAGQARVREQQGVTALLETTSEGRSASPNLFETTSERFLADHVLGDEVFGPLGIVVKAKSIDDMARLASSLAGQLTATIHMDDGDLASAQKLRPILERKAGRVVVNGFPTGVEVVDAMVHGGPYPASTNFGATSVGTMAIRRFVRPVAYQNLPEALLPEDARG